MSEEDDGGPLLFTQGYSADDDWQVVMSLPREEYRVVETADGWDILARNNHSYS